MHSIRRGAQPYINSTGGKVTPMLARACHLSSAYHGEGVAGHRAWAHHSHSVDASCLSYLVTNRHVTINQRWTGYGRTQQLRHDPWEYGERKVVVPSRTEAFA